MKILVVEDDDNFRRGLCALLELEGYSAAGAACGLDAMSVLEKDEPDFYILDVSLPGIDGFEVCRRIRARNQVVPILFLTARNEEVDRVVGLRHGADDYMGKPFSARELIARIQAIERRSSARFVAAPADSIFRMGDLRIDPQALRAYRQAAAIGLTAREMAILKLLHLRSGLVVSRDQLYDSCWGQDHFANSRALDQSISNLRRKIEVDVSDPSIIRTVHGAGYRYDP